jgi:flagellar P-ring protein precursor FlgI
MALLNGLCGALLAALVCVPGMLAAEDLSGVRLKDLCEIDGVRDNQLHGIGVVVGLSGSGDKTAATVRMLKQLLTSKNLSFTDADLQSKNVAMVAVTADLPAFKRSGDRVATQVACIGDASSLKGGILLQTAMAGADGRFYAVGQGPVSIGGFGNAGPALGGGGTGHANIETVATLSQGAIVEREVPMSMLVSDRLSLKLRNPDFTTASRIAKRLAETFGAERVAASDAEMVALLFPTKPDETKLVDTIAEVLAMRVEPDQKARVVINSRTGTVVAGRDVRISAVAVSHGGLSLRVQPKQVTNPQTQAKTIEWIDPATNLRSSQPPGGVKSSVVPGSLSVFEGATVEEIANGLNALGARPRDLIAIFQAIQSAGALHAELVEM